MFADSFAHFMNGLTAGVDKDLHHMTQKQLAEKLGIAPQTVSNMETGVRPISRETAYKLGELFDVPPGRFI